MQALVTEPQSGPWHGDVSIGSGYAVAMTHTTAIIWRYAQGSSSSEQPHPLKVQLPEITKDSRRILPLGTLVPTSGEPALLVVLPTSGRIIFWESLSSATIIDTKRQMQQSVQGTLSGMMSGEVVLDIMEAEPRGFVLTLSTGRLAHLIVSDTQGKASISVQYLRSNDVQGGGVLGSLRSVFSSAAWKKDIVAVRASHSLQRGQRFVIAATKTAKFQVWDLSWNGTGSLLYDMDAKEDVLKALSEGAEVFNDRQEQHMELLDFTMIPDGAIGKDVGRLGGTSDCKLMALTVLNGKGSSKFALVGLRLTGGVASIDVVHPIMCYTTSLPPQATFKPRVLVPEPAQMAFVILERTLILISLLEIEQSPESQLRMEAHALPDPFQDTIEFNQSKPYRVVGCAGEPFDQIRASASCIIMVYGFGLIRVAALPLKAGQTAADRKTVTAQTKIEQAIFFGSLRQDLLDFRPRPEMRFSSEEVERAALDVSRSILTSTSPYLPTITPSTEQQLSRRAKALSDLNKHLRQYYAPINKTINWILLSHAEKVAAAQEVWRWYDTTVQSPTQTPDTRNVLTELVEAIHSQYKVQNEPERYETDGVRHWFIHDIARLQWAVVYAQRIVETMFSESIEDKQELDVATKARMISEATDIHLSILETAYQFRETHAPAYGLGDESLQDGVLQNGYEWLPEEDLWTSDDQVVKMVKLLTDIAREFAGMYDNSPDEEAIEDDVSEALLIKLARDNPRQVQLCLQTNAERYKWLKSRDDAGSKAAGKALQRSHVALRRELLTKLGEIAQIEPAMTLAEKYHDMAALADIIENELENTDDEAVQDALQDRVKTNFVRFGTPWANAFFTKHLTGVGAVDILNQNAVAKQHLTNFLRNHADTYAKIGWLNEVTAEQNFGFAADFLEAVQRQTDHVWSQRITNGMRKLTILAAKSKCQAKEQTAAPVLKALDQSVAMLAVQEDLYAYIKPSVADALDAEAEADLAIERHSSQFMKSKSTYHKALHRNFEKLLTSRILSADELIETLTLLGVDQLASDPTSFMATRFLAALKVLQLDPAFASPDSSPAHRSFHERVIWRRCMILDDWPAINRTENKPDSVIAEEIMQTLLFQTLYHGYSAGFWDQSNQPLPPNEALLEAGTTVELLRGNPGYEDTPDNQLADIAADMCQEAEQLEMCLFAGRLGDRWAGVVEDARLAVREEADREGEQQAEMVEAKARMAKREHKKDREVMGFDEADDGYESEEVMGRNIKGKTLTPRAFWGD